MCLKAACGPARTGIAAPGAAAENVLSKAFLWPFGVCLRPANIFGVPVVAPLTDITVHLMKAPRIGRQTAYGHGFPARFALLAVGVGVAAIIVRLVGREGLAEREWSRTTRAAGVFPLRFRRKRVIPPVLRLSLAQSLEELLCVSPGN